MMCSFIYEKCCASLDRCMIIATLIKYAVIHYTSSVIYRRLRGDIEICCRRYMPAIDKRTIVLLSTIYSEKLV